MNFEDGMAYDLQTPIGVVTIVCDAHAVLPLRIYGPDGMQIEPVRILDLEGPECYGGYMAFDLRKYSGKRTRRRRER